MTKQLEVGPGPNPLGRDWDTLDIVKRPYLTYISDNPNNPFEEVPFSDYDIIYASHVLEHVSWYHTITWLKGAYESIIPDGRLEIWVPDFKKIISAYTNQGIPDSWSTPQYLNYEDRKGFESLPKPYNFFQWVNGRIFAYAENGQDCNFHRAMFDDIYLEMCLKETGFREIRKLDKPRVYDHGYINLGMSGIK